MVKVAYLGLGVMGNPMAGHLVKAGYDLTVYNRNFEKAIRWYQKIQNAGYGVEGVKLAKTPAEACLDAEFIMACVGADADILEVATGAAGAFSSAASGSVFIDHTTVSAHTAEILAKSAHEKNIHFIDAPVSGGEAGAINGTLTIMCGADLDVFNRARPILQAYGTMVERLGGIGSGQLAKMANQVCIAGILQGLSEAIMLAEKSGLDAKAVMNVISSGAAGSWQMKNRADTMVDDQFDFGFAVDWMRKDLGIVLDQARRVQASLPLTALVDQFYSDVQAAGGGKLDTSSLIKRLR